ncbi:MAG: uncharacterized protein KVP18_000856 [Porospora cf. gigantea A]|uniref:uncharacterized protein n=1 Tax=Porospora cf. gigantea A TaxID=2853593 RepID=UPI003559A8D2|nr:MAG: hypothetical protein KVP18_000856 [Porospora cf. gigantea A]
MNFTDPVAGTTDDASVSKASAESRGYYQDPYIKYIVPHPCRRSPLINRGYYARVAAIRRVLLTFFDLVPPTVPLQVVSLGAGLDTTVFWVNDILTGRKERELSLRSMAPFPVPEEFSRSFVYFELDFPEVLAKKTSLFMKHEALRRNVSDGDIDFNGGEFVRCDRERMIPCDLRDINSVDRKIKDAGLDPQLPTIFLSECCLVYLRPEESDAVIQWASEVVSAPSAFVTYEQVNADDAFGKTMMSNLAMRGCPLLTLRRYPTLETQRVRYENLGGYVVSVADMNWIYDHCLDLSDRLRIHSLELFDEIEEWRLVHSHYSIVVAVKGSKDDKRLADEVPNVDPGDIAETLVRAEDESTAISTIDGLYQAAACSAHDDRCLDHVLNAIIECSGHLSDKDWRQQTSLGYLRDLAGMWEKKCGSREPRFSSSQLRGKSTRAMRRTCQRLCSEQERSANGESQKASSFQDLLCLDSSSALSSRKT